MSESREFDDGVTGAADVLIEAYGVAGAIDELQARRQSGSDAEQARALEALAYIRREVQDE